MSRLHRIVCMPGDGIGPEIMVQARRVLEAASERFRFGVEIVEAAVGGAAIRRFGVALREPDLSLAREADAVLFGAVGDPGFDDPGATVRPEQAILGLRKGLRLFANLRPVLAHDALLAASPLRAEIVAGTDMLIVRELTGGIYFGARERWIGEHGRCARDTMVYDENEVRRVAELAFALACGRRRKVTSVDKANVLDTSRLWREVVTQVHREHPDVELEHVLVDSFAMHILKRPRDFDVVVTENMFGDILSDEASVLTGSLGVMPSASVGEPRPDGTRPGLYEPIHGSAPDIAGKGVANPVGMILSVAAMLRLSLGHEEAATAVERAVAQTIAAGLRTRELGGDARTEQVGAAVAERLARPPRT
jgi:3-isopropylmalate dehydrogenase